MTDARLERWLDAVLATPGLTALRNRDEAHRVLLEDALAGAPLVELFAGPVVDVGSGGGTPGIPLAVALPDREVTLLEANGRKAAFLERLAVDLPNVGVVRGRAEEQPTEAFGAATAKALAPPPVAAEWCLPLVRVGGGVVLWVGPTAETGAVAAVAAHRRGHRRPANPTAGRRVTNRSRGSGARPAGRLRRILAPRRFVDFSVWRRTGVSPSIQPTERGGLS